MTTGRRRWDVPATRVPAFRRARLLQLVGLSALLALVFVVGAGQAARPAAPPGAAVLAPGAPPHECGKGDVKYGATGYGPVSGVYYSAAANTWVSAPLCYPRWGNLQMSAAQVAQGGGRATVVATPSEGSNSAEWATKPPGAIQWQPAGTPVAKSCTPTSLTCTVQLPPAGPEWQWLLFHVSLPRTYFIDSPGEFCAGQHACAGTGTNGWTYVGIPPQGVRPTTKPTQPKTTSPTKTTPKTTTPTKKTATPEKLKGATCVPADCSGLQVKADSELSTGDTGATMNAGCGGQGGSGSGGGGSSCDINATLDEDIKALQSSDKEAQLKAQKKFQQDLASFDDQVADLEKKAQQAIQKIEQASAAKPPNQAELKKAVDSYGSAIEDTLGTSEALDAAEQRALQDLSSSDPAVQARGQRALADIQIRFQAEIDRIQAGTQAVQTGLRTDSQNAQHVSDHVGDTLADQQDRFQQVANDAASIDAAMEQASRDLASPDRATQQRGQQAMLQAQQRLQAQITQIEQAGNAAQTAIHGDSTTPRAVVQDQNAAAANFQHVADSAESLQNAEEQAYRDLTSSDPAIQRRGQLAIQSAEAQLQQLSSQLQQQSAAAAARIQGNASIPPSAGYVNQTAAATDGMLSDFDDPGYGAAGGAYSGLDGSAGGTIPSGHSGLSAGVMQRATATASASVPKTKAVIDSIYSKHPRASDVTAFLVAVKLATAPKYSPARAKARIQLILALHIGHAALVHELGYDLHTGKGGHSPVILGHAASRIPAGTRRAVTVRSTTVGGRILRLLDLYGLSHKSTVRLLIVSKHGGKTSTTSKQLTIG